MQNITLKVIPENSQQRLDVFLTKTIEEAPSRSFIQKLIEKGGVRVNGRRVKPHYKVAADDEIAVHLPDEEESCTDIQPENIPLEIVFEDNDLLVINKPEGMLVHPAHGCNTGTLVNALLFHRKELSEGIELGRPGIVHRLDKETSGIMVVAKNNRAHVHLSRQFEKRLVRKRYLALVEGLVEFEEGLIDASLGKHPRHFDKKAVVFEEDARCAKTFYMVLKRGKTSSLVGLYPKTGRTHQLRVHMAHLGHPILGDEKYGKKQTFPRLALHAQCLGMFHPTTTHFIEFCIRPPAGFLNPP